jgi:hypothetical protein
VCVFIVTCSFAAEVSQRPERYECAHRRLAAALAGHPSSISDIPTAGICRPAAERSYELAAARLQANEKNWGVDDGYPDWRLFAEFAAKS